MLKRLSSKNYISLADANAMTVLSSLLNSKST